MENRKSLLRLDKIPIAPGITLKIPTVGEVLDNEQSYYSLTYSLTSSPFSYMVQLDDLDIDYTTINDWQLFCMLFCGYSNQIVACQNKICEIQEKMQYIESDSKEYMDCFFQLQILQQKIADVGLDMVFEDFKMTGIRNGSITGFSIYVDPNGNEVLYNPSTDVQINEFIFKSITDSIRKINQYEKVTSKPGNEKAKKYLLEKERKKQKRNAKKKYEPYLENIVIAMVNNREFPYDYDTCMNLSIYKFNQSFKQVQRKIEFDNVMRGVYAGTIDVSKMLNKDCLSWWQIKS